MQSSVNTRHGVERIVRYAFDLAMRPDRRRKVTLVHKTNVLTFAGDLYQRVVDEVAIEYPDVITDYVHVDAACIYFLDDPSRFDVIVTDNMFGDIITDLGAMIQGGMGIAAGGNINPDRRIDVRADRRHRRRRRAKARSIRSPRSAPQGCSCPQLGEAARRRASTPASASACSKIASMRAGEMGYSTPRSATSVGARGRVTARTGSPQRRALRHDPARRRPGAGALVLRRGPAADPPQARPARPALHRGRLAGGEPARHGVLPPRGEGEARERRARRVRDDPAGGGEGRGPPVPRDLLDAGTETVCFVGKSWDVHVRGAPDRPRRGVAMVRTRPVLRGQGRRVFFDAEHFFDGYAGDSGVRRSHAGGRGGGRRRAVGALRYERRQAALRRRARRGRGCRRLAWRRPSGFTPTTTPGARSRPRSPPSRRCLQIQGGQRLRRTERERGHRADRGQPRAEVDAAGSPGRRGAADRAVPLRRRGRQHRARAHQPYAGAFAFTHKAGLHAALARFARRTSTSPPERPSGTIGAWSPPTSGAPRPSR